MVSLKHTKHFAHCAVCYQASGAQQKLLSANFICVGYNKLSSVPYMFFNEFISSSSVHCLCVTDPLRATYFPDMFVFLLARRVESIFVKGNNSLLQIMKGKLPLCAATMMNNLDLLR